MPRIDDIVVTETRFKKKKYRPWNLLDEDITNTSSEDPSFPPKSSTSTNTLQENDINNVKVMANSKKTVSQSLADRELTVSKHTETALLPKVNQTSPRLPSSVDIKPENEDKIVSTPLAIREHTVSKNTESTSLFNDTSSENEDVAIHQDKSVSEPLAIREHTVSKTSKTGFLFNDTLHKSKPTPFSINTKLENKDETVREPAMKTIQKEDSLHESPPPAFITDLNLINVYQDENSNISLRESEQSVSQSLAHREHTVSKTLALSEQSVSQPLADSMQDVSKPLAYALANGEHTVSTKLANHEKLKNNKTVLDNLDTATGKEEKLLFYLFENCRNNGSLVTKKLSSEKLQSLLMVNATRLRNIIYRLSTKGLITVDTIKNGMNAWRIFRFSEEVFQKLVIEEKVRKEFADEEQFSTKTLNERNYSNNKEHDKTINKPLAYALAEPLANAPSSSSVLNITTTTEETENFDIEPLAHIGFTNQHLNQIIKHGKIETSFIQQSIYAFAYDLETGNAKKITTSPLNFFMGILKRGNIYTPLSKDYIDPQEKARKIFLEKIKQQKEEKRAVEKELLTQSYREWFRNLTDEEKKTFVMKIIPENQKTRWFQYQHDYLEKYFKDHIWPENREGVYQQSGLPFVSLMEVS